MSIIIPDTSLCAIVRDEVMNPAGGIFDFINCTMPFLERGVIVDTGSLDGTREVLEEMSSQYPNLTIFDAKFMGYAHARNISLGKVKTKYAFVLDADERLSQEDFEQIKKCMDENGMDEYNFRLMNIYPFGEDVSGGHNPRLFDNGGEYKYTDWGGKWEQLRDKFGSVIDGKDTRVYIKHFVSSPNLKMDQWYDGTVADSVRIGLVVPAPSTVDGFADWRRRNPLRRNYSFGLNP